MGLDESLQIGENILVVPELGGTNIDIRETFGTHNNFYGGQLGLDWEYRRGRWTFDVLGKVALGDSHEVVIINGATATTVPGEPTTVQPFGFFALPTNIGRFTRDEFAVVPEVGVKLGYQITPHIKFTVGYTFLYWSDVVRPGDQFDRVLNLSQIGGPLVGPARPAPL